MLEAIDKEMGLFTKVVAMVLSIGAAAAFVTPSGFAGRGCMERGTGGGRATLAGGRSSGISMAVLDVSIVESSYAQERVFW